MGRISWVFAVVGTLGCVQPPLRPTGPEPADGEGWLARVEETLKGSSGTRWSVALEVRKGLQGILAPGTHRFRFDVGGPKRVHWIEEHPAEGKPLSVESWYQGYLLYQRETGTDDPLNSREFGESEGDCLAYSMARGGVVGWQLVHLTVMGNLLAEEARVVGEDHVDGRPAVIVEHRMKIKGVCGSKEELPGARIWIDRERGVPLQREHRFTLDVGREKLQFEAVERYTGWKIGHPIPDATFRVEGMGRADPLADLPASPEEFEKVQTERALGIPVLDFPGPRGPKGFAEAGALDPPVEFVATPREPTGTPAPWYSSRPLVRATAPDGSEFEAFMGYDDSKVLARGHGFVSDRTNRRHQYGEGAYHPQDVYIGRKTPGLLRATLFFRDVGSHNTAPHALAVDHRGRCHLSVAAVDIGQGNRFKLYHAVGDPVTGKWEEAWLVQHDASFTSSARAWTLAEGERVHVLWSRATGGKGGGGIFHVEFGPRGPGEKTRLLKAEVDNLDVAIDREGGRLLLAYSTEEGILLMSRPREGRWTAPARLDPTLADRHDVSVQAEGGGAFIVRAARGVGREWGIVLK